MVRNHVRSQRRRQIAASIIGAKSESHVVNIIIFMNSHLRATCILDMDEHLNGHDPDRELCVENSWWSNYDITKIYDILKEKGFA